MNSLTQGKGHLIIFFCLQAPQMQTTPCLFAAVGERKWKFEICCYAMLGNGEIGQRFILRSRQILFATESSIQERTSPSLERN